MRRTFFIAPTVYAVLIAIAAVAFFNFGYGTVSEATPTTTEQATLANLVQQIELLQEQIKVLQKNILLLADQLDEINKRAPATATILPTAPQRKLRSPRQVDRTPIREEKVDALLVKLQVAIEDTEEERVYTKLLTTKNKSNFVQSLRSQLIEWLSTSSEERAFDSPMSAKQFAWAGHLMFKSDYPNPKTIRELYPNG